MKIIDYFMQAVKDGNISIAGAFAKLKSVENNLIDYKGAITEFKRRLKIAKPLLYKELYNSESITKKEENHLEK